MAAGDPEQFMLDIQRFVDLAQGRLQAFTTLFIQNMNEVVVKATPVDTGNLRASWWASIGTPPATLGEAGADPSGAQTIARLNLTAATMPLGQTYWAVNGAVYAMRVEFGFVGQDSLGRTYNQRPRAYVRRSLRKAELIARITARQVAAL